MLSIEDLHVVVDSERGPIPILRGVSLEVKPHETLGIVGESGCGKTMTSLAVMGLLPQGARITRGTMRYRNRGGEVIDIAGLSQESERMRSMRGNEIAMIFQEPMTSLNPLHRIGHQIEEAVRLHRHVDRVEAGRVALQMLREVEIAAPEQRLREYPHQLSGGMRQRVMIAMALSCSPSLLIADEPTSALDVTIEAQVLTLIARIQTERRMSVMMITHDLGVVGEVADRVVVLYLGEIMERAPTYRLFDQPRHPYTLGLIRARPQIGRRESLIPIDGTVPGLMETIRGCPFASRCPLVLERCRRDKPPLEEVAPGHHVRCWVAERSDQ